VTPVTPDLDRRLILASKSRARAAVLRSAGLDFVQIVANVDEETIRDSMRSEGASVTQQVDLLAETKAMKVSQAHRGVALGADQMLDLDGEAFDKPRTLDEARDHLRRLRGRTHVLQTSIVACVEGSAVWRHLAQPRLRMRNFTDAFLDGYLADSGETLLGSVGAYQIEGRGAQLFDRIDGDYFSILGLPLLPLLGWLRDRGTLAQ